MSSSAPAAVSRAEPSVAPAFYASLPHHAGKTFRSPWPSAGGHGFLKFFKARLLEWNEVPLPTHGLDELVQAVQAAQLPPGKVAVTWLGHASGLITLPSAGGPMRVLVDPVFAQRCSPVQFMGPARYTRAPATVAQLLAGGPIDVVAISHSHYDHLCVPTLSALIAAADAQHPLPHFAVPLGLASFMRSLGVPADHITELDWWGRARLTFAAPAAQPPAPARELLMTCTPAQHFSGRGLFDRDTTLWAGWAMDSLEGGANVYFAGDSGFRAVPGDISREEEEKLPHCPAFSEIGDVLGPFDLAMIPIGAYLPRSCMSVIHMAPHEAVAVHKMVQSRKSLGIHWGVFRLTPEDVLEPRVLLEREATAQGLQPDEFVTTAIGATLYANAATRQRKA